MISADVKAETTTTRNKGTDRLAVSWEEVPSKLEI